ncbi:cutinase family protein [Mycolicibacterium madagascariense]|uniref:cutinase family protein n=1 Tax=Mycolicibacterium madagascariense TaxID=212765 RepID=UPI001FE47719|nr:cutinase family protein [Mycolicibacterium madagascariense]
MIRRLGWAVLIAGLTLSGLGTATASAAAECADYHWIGAAGSGQRDAAGLATNGGMGGVVYQSYLQLRDELAASGLTIDAEAVQYPAAPVPLDGGLGGWMGFMDSVKAGTAATAKQYTAFTKACPATKVVLAGYSQGAMVVHRNLASLADAPNVAAVLLVADGDRLPGDTTIDMGTTATPSPATLASTASAVSSSDASVPDAGKGVAQEHSFLASAPTSTLPPAMGAKTVSVCDVHDPVCDYDSDTELTPATLAIHTSYAPTVSGPHAWVAPLYQLAMSAGANTEPSTALTLSTHGS